MPKFSANIMYLFNEFDLINRFEAAASVGFKAVECQRPYNIPAPTVQDLLEEYQIEMVLVNTPASPAWPHDKGLAIFPKRVQAFRETIEIAINYAVKVGCPRLHVLAGSLSEGLNLQKAEETFISNLQWTAELGKKNRIKILIEPLNAKDNPGYFLTTAAQAVQLLSNANHDNLYLQYDLYHAKMNGEDVITGARNYLHLIEHMQMASVPGRCEPSTTDIELMSTFTAIDDMGYQGWIGAEYTPIKSTFESLNWGAAYGIG